MKGSDFVFYGMAMVGMTFAGMFVVPVAAVLFGIHMYNKKRKESLWD